MGKEEAHVFFSVVTDECLNCSLPPGPLWSGQKGALSWSIPRNECSPTKQAVGNLEWFPSLAE